MKKNTIIKLSIGIIVLIAILVGGWFFSQNSKTPVTEKTPKPTASNSAEANPTASSTASSTMSYEDFEKEKEAVKGTTEVDFFSKEDVDQVLLTAQDYANTSLTNKYFLSGKWATEGYPMAQLDKAVGEYYSEPLREKIRKLDVKTATTKDTLPLVFYVADNGEVSPSPLCAATIDNTDGKDKPVNNEPTLTCPVGSVKISEMKYQSVTTADDEHHLAVDFTANVKIPVTLNGTTPASTDVTYTYHVEFMNNPYYDEVTNPQKFVIANYKNDILAKKVEASNNE